MENQYWKIGDFSAKLGKHKNTVDGWFRSLEEERNLHYVTRINGEKVYDQLDLEIAEFILLKRNAKWSLEGIFDALPNHFNLREFPNDFQPPTVQVVDVDQIRATITAEIKASFEQLVAVQAESQLLNLQKLLPSAEQQRLDRFNDLIAQRKVSRSLEEEALSIWETKPVEERFTKVGWFRKIEDKDKRNRFIVEYIDAHFEQRMKEEFDL